MEVQNAVNSLLCQDAANMCRTCLTKAEILQSVFESSLQEMLQACTGIQVNHLPFYYSKSILL